MMHTLKFTDTLRNGMDRWRCQVSSCRYSVRVDRGTVPPEIDGCGILPLESSAILMPPQLPPKIMPSLWQRARNLARDAVEWASEGFPIASKQEKARRLAICEKCDRLQKGRCVECGCCMGLKSWIETGKCKLGKWEPCRNARIAIPDAGLISPALQWCIQIEITNACPRHCSNCTRHCPHVAEPFYMDAETFTRAVESMQGYPGMVGIQGGEPTLHPHFAELVDIYKRLWIPDHGEVDWGRQPIADFGGYVADQLGDTLNRRGLWSATGAGYYKHYETIQETFPYQCLNDHANPAKHAPLLVTRKELGIDDATWRGYRDRCWIQRQWSSSITPKGCFPCEIMASLDMLYDGPGGWPIEPGWWKRQPADFGDMLDWCEQCGACLPLLEREARGGVQDVSLHHLEQLWRVGSPAVRDGKYKVFDAANWKPSEVRQDADRYMPEEYRRKRVADSNRSIKPHHIEAFVVCVGCGDQLARVLSQNAKQVDRLVVVTSLGDKKTQEVALETDGPIELVMSDDCYRDGDAFNKGRMLNHGLEALRLSDWVLNLDADILLPADFGERIRTVVLNPGCLYYTRRRDLLDDGMLGEHGGINNDFAPWGYFQLWHPRAKALRDLPKLRYPDRFVSAGNVDTWWQLHWPWAKKIPLGDDPAWDVGHVPHGPLAARWNGSHFSTAQGWRYVGQNNIKPDLPAVDRGNGGFLRIVRVDDCLSAVVPVDSIQWDRPHPERIYEYQWRPDYYGDTTTWRAFFEAAAKC